MFNFASVEIQYLVPALWKAISLAKKIQSELVSPTFSKDDYSPVSVADFTIQALLAHELMRLFPTDTILAEEDSYTLKRSNLMEPVYKYVVQAIPTATRDDICTWLDYGRNRSSSRLWTLDPIDGTKGFLRGDQYAIALALLVHGRVEIGLLGCPNWPSSNQMPSESSDSVIVAVRGEGARLSFVNDLGTYSPLYVSNQKNPSDMKLLRSYEQSHTNLELINNLSTALKMKTDPILMDSQAKYAVLASGNADLILRTPPPNNPDYREKIWDIAAGSLVVEEAGGRVSDMNGRALDFSTGKTLDNNAGVIVSNGILHDKILEYLINKSER